MPCDQRIQCSAPDLAKLNRKRLADVLRADGWAVDESEGALYASNVRLGANLRLGAGTATLSCVGNTERILAAIRRSYASRTVVDVSARFGFRVQAKVEQDQAQTIILRR